MFPSLQQRAIPIVTAVAYYVSGFFIMANVLALNGPEIELGLSAGAIGGLCVLMAAFWREEHRSAAV